MTRFWIALCLGGWLSLGMVRAQEAAAADSGSTSAPAPETSTITPGAATDTAPDTSTPPATESAPTTIPSGLSEGVPSGTTPTTTTTEAPPTSFSLPGGNGFAPQIVTAGEGRFAQPPFRFTVSISQGYNDNVFSSPTDPIRSPSSVTVLVPTPRQVVTFRGGKPVVRTEVDLVKTKVRLRQSDPQERIGSAVSTVGVSFQTQAITPRTLYSVDASLGALYYYSRPGRSLDYNGRLGLSFVHRINPRLTVSAQGDAVYSSQPDFSRINTPSRQIQDGAYLSSSAKLDAIYLWSSRITTDTSYTFSSTVSLTNSSTDATTGAVNDPSINDYFENGLNNEVRYLWSPRVTAVLDLRATESSHPNDPNQDTTNFFFLAGVDYAASSRLHFTIRAGDETRSYNEGGATLSTPYAETTTSYIFIRGSSASWTNRFGYEESGGATVQRLTYRTNLALNYVVGARLRLGGSVAYNHSNLSAVNGGTQADYTEQQLQLSLGAQYLFSPSLQFYVNYSLTELFSSLEGQDYYTNQIFLGGNYSF